MTERDPMWYWRKNHVPWSPPPPSSWRMLWSDARDLYRHLRRCLGKR